MTRARFLTSTVGFPLLAQPTPTSMVFVGFPLHRSMNLLGNNETTMLEKQESDEYVCMITRKNGKHYWSSRDRQELIKNISGDFVIFTALDGRGYVKIAPTMKELALNYMEHLHDKLFTITYWGKISVYRA
ncbi:MAG: hypothetical protein HXY18_10300 [Bryobacteraceae bacterium]|nr:hypothetical protein [Bryobacteraceae bacterium]